MNHSHNAFHEFDVPEDVEERAVWQKIQFLYAVLEEYLITHQSSLIRSSVWGELQYLYYLSQDEEACLGFYQGTIIK
jgi:hypothetical protein